jgi:hypothetical protein
LKLHSRVIPRYYKKILMALCLFIVVFECGSAFCGSAKEDVRQNPGVRRQLVCENGFECFDDFIIYLKDDREPAFRDKNGIVGEDKILVCNLAVELYQGMTLSTERIELKKIIYKTLKGLSGLPRIKSGLKEIIKRAIKIRLNNFMDSETIKEVYFNKFVLL